MIGIFHKDHPRLFSYVKDTCSILIKNTKSNTLPIRLAIVNALKNIIEGTQIGLPHIIQDLTKLFDKLSKVLNPFFFVSSSMCVCVWFCNTFGC